MRDELLMKFNSVGSYRVGKTSLIRRYAENQFSSDYLPTLGVDITVKRLNIDYKDSNFNVRVVLMDTAGQEQFGKLRNTYFQGAAGCIAVYDVTRRESFDDLNRWIADFQGIAGKDSQIVIIGNKIDLKELRTVSTNEGRNYAFSNGYPFFECSAKLGDDLITEIYTRLIHMNLDRINI